MTAPEQRPIPRHQIVEANELAAQYFRQRLLAESAAGPRSYLESRGLGYLLADTRWTVGYAPPGWTSMRDHLLKQGLSPGVLGAAGLVSPTSRGSSVDRFRDRLTFGVRDLDGVLVGFTARCAPGSPDSIPKYLNTPRTPLYNKSSVMFGLGEQAGRLHDGYNLVLVEGPLDALAVDYANAGGGASRLASLALCGTAMTDSHGAIVSRLARAHVIVAFDPDPAGMKATEAAYMASRETLTNIYSAALPTGSDPAQSLAAAGPDGLLQQLTQLRPLVDAIVDNRIHARSDLHENAEARVACLREVAHVLSGMTPLDVTRQARRLPGKLGLDQATVTRELANAVSAPTPSKGPTSGLRTRNRTIARSHL